MKAFFLNWVLLFLRLFEECRRSLLRLSLLELIYILAACFMLISSLLPWLVYEIEFFAEKQELASSLRWFFFLTAFLASFSFFIHLPYKNLYAPFFLLLCLCIYFWGIFAPGDVHSSVMAEEDYHLSISCYLYGLALLLALATSVSALNPSLFRAEGWKNYLRTRAEL